jgi:hypothetical protein
MSLFRGGLPLRRGTPGQCDGKRWRVGECECRADPERATRIFRRCALPREIRWAEPHQARRSIRAERQRVDRNPSGMRRVLATKLSGKSGLSCCSWRDLSDMAAGIYRCLVLNPFKKQRMNASVRARLCADAAGFRGPRESNCRNALSWMSPKRVHGSKSIDRARFRTIFISI